MGEESQQPFQSESRVQESHQYHETKPLEFFIPMINEFFSSPRLDDSEQLARHGNR